VTAAIDDAVAPLRIAGGPDIEVVGLAEGPPGISSQRDADSVVMPLVNRVTRDDADAFVLACFSDPGLHAVREAAGGRPVLGIAECGIFRALMLGEPVTMATVIATVAILGSVGLSFLFDPARRPAARAVVDVSPAVATGSAAAHAPAPAPDQAAVPDSAPILTPSAIPLAVPTPAAVVDPAAVMDPAQAFTPPPADEPAESRARA